MKRVLTRRQYLAGTAAGLAAAALQAQPPKQPSNALPRRVLGRTGVSVPILGFGSGSRFTNFYTDDAGEAALRQAIDCGITYLDTAAGYGNGRSETIYGRVLKTRRSEVFLATKNAVRDADQALRVFEQGKLRQHSQVVKVQSVGRVCGLEIAVQRRELFPGRVVSGQVGADAARVLNHPRALRRVDEATRIDCGTFDIAIAITGALHRQQVGQV